MPREMGQSLKSKHKEMPMARGVIMAPISVTQNSWEQVGEACSAFGRPN